MIKEMLRNIKYYILDMDGTFYIEDNLIEGSKEFIEHIRVSGKDFLFFTNNSSKNVKAYEDRLEKMGCIIRAGQVITSGMVTAKYIKSRWKNSKVYLLGTPLLENDFIASGITLTNENPDAVVVGFDTTLTYEKLSTACTLIRNGVPFIATHLDFNCPVVNGFIPDCGAICAFITASTGIKPKYLGKPFYETLEYILEYLNCSKDEIAFVGDRLYTDIAMGFNHNVKSILVLTGETKLEDLKTTEIIPDIVVNGLKDLI